MIHIIEVEQEPTVVHFSGHGRGFTGFRVGELIITSAHSEHISADEVTGVIEHFRPKMVVLSACQSTEQTAIPQDNRPVPVPRRTNRAFDTVQRVVPMRIANEEFGDAMEVIYGMIQQRRPSWRIYLKITFTVFWILAHALYELGQGAVKKLKGR
jgi:hypothetical protein